MTHDRHTNSMPIVVALADDAAAPSILHVVHELARSRGATPTIVEVAEVSMYTGWDATVTRGLMVPELLGPEFRVDLEKDVRARYHGDNGIPDSWPVDIRVGDATMEIHQCISAVRAELLVMGLNHHGWLARTVGEHTTLHVLRGTSVPVLAVRPGLDALPGHVMVAMDFSTASVRAARVALRIMDTHGTLQFAHVRSSLVDETEQSEGMRLVNAEGVKAAFDMVVRELDVPATVTVKRTTLDGDPIAALRTIAEHAKPDLIAIGSQRHTWLDRHLLGSVTTAIVSDARWSVLVTPPALARGTT